MTIQTKGIIVSNREIKTPYFLLEIYCPSMINKMKPGQFIMIRISSETNDPLLRRPFSIYKCYSMLHPEKSKRGHLLILYKKIGKGTRRMAEFKKGENVDMIGPLGNGFTLPPLPSSSNIILIGGGVGIVSLYPLAEVLGSKNILAFIGGKTRDDILCLRDFRRLNSNIFIATEDGGLGFKGTVVDLFLSQKKTLKGNETYYLYACGPLGMLKELTKMVKSKRFICQASLETRMGCGFGACWGCVVKTNNPKMPYQRVCKEGPVFNLEEIVWE